MIPIIIFVFMPRGKVFGKALEDATTRGTVTADLTAAFHDRVVSIAHGYELAVTAIVIVLMVMKPF